jgi:superfamily II DNA/RNA helicase
VVVATGTGSGKTEAYLLPIISHLATRAKHRAAPRTVRRVSARCGLTSRCSETS